MNRLARPLALLSLAVAVSAAGCSKDKPADGAQPEAAKSAAKGAAQPAAAKAAAAPAAPAATADAAMTALMNGVMAQKAEAVWDFLPASYQKEITGIVHETAGKMDAEVYDKALGVLGKAVGVLKTQKAFIFASPMMKEVLANPMLPPGAVEKNWDAVVELLGVVTSSELSKVATLKTIDLRAFMANTGGKLMTRGFAIAKVMGQDPTAALAGFKAETVKTEGDKATVKMTPPGGGEPSEAEFVKVEGKWIPADLAKDWPEALADAKKQLAEMPAQLAEAKPMLMPVLMQVEGAVEKLGAAKTQAEFDGAIAGLMAGMGGGAPPAKVVPMDAPE